MTTKTGGPFGFKPTPFLWNFMVGISHKGMHSNRVIGRFGNTCPMGSPFKLSEST